MASSLLKSSERHDYLVSECNYLFLQLPENEYILHDLGLRIVVKHTINSERGAFCEFKKIKIEGLSTDPIDFWDDIKLEKMYSKLCLIITRLYEMEINLQNRLVW